MNIFYTSVVIAGRDSICLFYDLQCGVTFLFLVGNEVRLQNVQKTHYVFLQSVTNQANDLSTNGEINGVNGISLSFFSSFFYGLE